VQTAKPDASRYSNVLCGLRCRNVTHSECTKYKPLTNVGHLVSSKLQGLIWKKSIFSLVRPHQVIHQIIQYINPRFNRFHCTRKIAWRMRKRNPLATRRYTSCLSDLNRRRLHILERWARNWSRCTGSQPAGDHPPGRRLPLLYASRRSSPPLNRYQFIPFGDRGTWVWTTCSRLLRSFCPSRIRIHDLLIASPTLYP